MQLKMAKTKADVGAPSSPLGRSLPSSKGSRGGTSFSSSEKRFRIADAKLPGPVSMILALFLLYVSFLFYNNSYTDPSGLRSLKIQDPWPCTQASNTQPGAGFIPPRLATLATTTSANATSGIVSLPLPASSATGWDRYSTNSQIPLTFPIFVTSLPKSGTTSIWKFFRCGGIRSAHNWVRKHGSHKSTLAGLCIRDNIRHQRPPFHRCGAFDLYSDTGYINYDHDTGLDCFFPSIDGLHHIYASYPNATFVNVVRNTDDWFNSLKAWAHGSLFVRFRMCNATGLPNGQASGPDFKTFYEHHNAMIRQFVQERPSLTYLEVQLESPETGRILADATGISESCWKNCKPDQPLCEGEA